VSEGWPAFFSDNRLHLARHLARRRGQSSWLCGGAIRDALLGRPPVDLDLAADGDAVALAQDLAHQLNGRCILLDPDHQSCRIVADGQVIDLTGLRAPTIEQDLAARDFTINAMATPLDALLDGRPVLLDPSGGQADLRAGLLRPAGEGVLRADPLRVLRAGRFAAELSLSPAPGLPERLGRAAPGLANTPKERLAHEWLAMLEAADPSRGVSLLERGGALGVLLPALDAGRGLGQNPFHHLDVFDHNLACLAAAQDIWRDPTPLFGAMASEVADYLTPPRRRALLFCAALLHDVGKPATRLETGPGWATFHRHDIVGAEMAHAACQRLGLAKADSRFVARMTAMHMRPFHLLGAQNRGQLTARGARRLIQASGDDLPGLFILAMADTVAGRGPQRPPDAEKRLVRLYGRVAHLRDSQLKAALAAPPLLDGRQLMSLLGIGPGPEVGRLLALLREAQLDGAIANPYEALNLARRRMRRG